MKIQKLSVASSKNASHFKILHLTSTLSSAGAETMLTSLVSSDSSNIHTVCSIYSGGPYKKKLEDVGISIHSLGIPSSLLMPFAFFKFFFLVLKEKPDIIHSYLFLDNIISRVIGKITGKKVLCSKRDSDRWKPWFVHVFNRLTSWLADATVTNFNDGIRELKRNGVATEKIFYIPNGKNIHDYELNLSKEEAKKRIDFSERNLILTFTGRLVWYKGQEYLIKAFPSILMKYPNARLLLVGEGKNRKYFEQLANSLNLENKIIFLGNRNDIPQILKATDIFVSPSLRDGMPGAVMEAMVAGLPIVATDADGSKDLIKDYKNGILIPIKDSNAIAEKVIELINNKELADKLGKNARETIAKHFTAEKMVCAYQKLYNTMMEKA